MIFIVIVGVVPDLHIPHGIEPDHIAVGGPGRVTDLDGLPIEPRLAYPLQYAYAHKIPNQLGGQITDPGQRALDLAERL